jgi:hypothetical protein
MSNVPVERRRAVRTRVLRGASISLHHVGTLAQCTVRNLSDAGACLIVNDPVSIPSEFDLALEREKLPRRCHVIWREQNRIGVEFR